MDEEIEEDAAPEPQEKPGKMGFILALVAITLLGGGAGAGFGLMQVNQIASVATKRANTTPTKADAALAWDENTGLERLKPVIVNLANPVGTRVRLDTAMVFDREAVDDVKHLKAVLSEDLLAFLRTVTMSELTGASAFNHLRDDLNERVEIASSGAVKELIIETMVLQ
ncbi:flagellar basal body-associated FliL family protein [Acuticoccus mangrovi]|uniref:Flagellar protein FliL n=1 Tax=Acuticoccus mangrovi TaxID=2796142 RepID=A0A934ITX7_9HYPH|nr:flagellar basal body-associated FliL family protein [Acuticoccus mangrovi]MBJ3778685.1 flagellar basal body-associated FliL family protein [Acuticoccus mangrovi]